MDARSRFPQLLALIVLVLAGGLLWTGQLPVPTDSHAKVTTPREVVGPWAGTPLSVDQQVLDVLETDDVSLIKYRLGEEPPVWFSQVAGFGKRAAYHPPEICILGSNFQILQRDMTEVITHGTRQRMMRLVLAQGNLRLETWYWFTAGDRATPNYYQQQLWLMLDTIRGEPAGGTLVRISTPIDSPVASRRRLLAFVNALTPDGRLPAARYGRLESDDRGSRRDVHQDT